MNILSLQDLQKIDAEKKERNLEILRKAREKRTIKARIWMRKAFKKPKKSKTDIMNEGFNHMRRTHEQFGF